MLIACLGVITGVLVTLLGITAISHVRTNRAFNDISQAFKEYIAEGTPDQPSNFVKNIYQVADIFADRIRIALTARDLGAEGAAARDLNRGLQDYATAHDPAAAVAGQIINGSKSLKKNTLAQQGLQMALGQIFSKMQQGQQEGFSPAKNNGTGSIQPKFKL